MIYRSQDRMRIFCFGRGCSLEIHELSGRWILSAFTGIEATKVQLGEYKHKDCAVLALEYMLKAIGEDGKMDTPSDEDMEDTAEIKEKRWLEWRAEQRASGTPLDELYKHIKSNAITAVTTLEARNIFTVEQASSQTVDEMSGYMGKALAKKVKAAVDEILNN